MGSRVAVALSPIMLIPTVLCLFYARIFVYFFGWLWKYARRAFVAVEFDSNGLWLVFACLYVVLFLLVLVLALDVCEVRVYAFVCVHTIGKCV